MFETEIKAGVAYLDEHYSRETWLPKINLETLRIRSDNDCVLGQIEGAFSNANIDTQVANACGFYISYHLCFNRPGIASLSEEYETLDDEWKATITALRG